MKLKLSPYVRHEAAMGSTGITSHILTSAPDGDKCSAAHPGHFKRGKRVSDTDCLGGWVNTTAGTDSLENISTLSLPETEEDSCSLQPSRYTDSTISLPVST